MAHQDSRWGREPELCASPLVVKAGSALIRVWAGAWHAPCNTPPQSMSSSVGLVPGGDVAFVGAAVGDPASTAGLGLGDALPDPDGGGGGGGAGTGLAPRPFVEPLEQVVPGQDGLAIAVSRASTSVCCC